MAQTSYGTITITDTTDITNVFTQYCLAWEDQNVTNDYIFNNPQVSYFNDLHYLTEDKEIIFYKKYYKRYTEAVVGTNDNPMELELYEYDSENNIYIATTDTSPINGKIYYHLYTLITPSGEGWFEQFSRYVLSTDTTQDEEKIYYNKVYTLLNTSGWSAEQKQELNPQEVGLYIKNNNIYILTTDTYVHNNTNYYIMDYVVVTATNQNPQNKGWYELEFYYILSNDNQFYLNKIYCYYDSILDDYIIINPAQLEYYELGEIDWFILTADIEPLNNKPYFELIDNQYYVKILDTTENPNALNLYEINSFRAVKTGYQNWCRQIVILEGVNVPQYGTPYLSDDINEAINKIVDNLDTIDENIDAINIDLNNLLDFETETTTNISDIQLVLQERLKKFWENLSNKFQITADTQVISGKQYYTLDENEHFVEVNNPGPVNPSENDYYELYYPAGIYTALGIPEIDFNEEDPDTYGYNLYIGNEINFRYNTTLLTTLSRNGLSFFKPDATLAAHVNEQGMIVGKGGIIAGNPETNSYVYLSSEIYSGETTIAINGNSDNWRQIIGTKFGVTDDGTLYTQDACIQGTVTASNFIAVDSDNRPCIEVTDNGINIIAYNDNNDREDIAWFNSEGVHFNGTKPQKIGGQNAYIQFIPADENNNFSESIDIHINGNNIVNTINQVENDLQYVNTHLSVDNSGLTLTGQLESDQIYQITEDTTVVPNKTYYTYNNNTNTYTVVDNPSSNPHGNNYYELLVSEYKLLITPQDIRFVNKDNQSIASYGKEIKLGAEGNTVTTITNDSTRSRKMIFTELYPRYRENETTLIGDLVIIARSNGHLSIKPGELTY